MRALGNVLLCLTACTLGAHALFEPPIVSFEAGDGGLDITRPLIVVDADDHIGVHIAANAVADDFERVTGSRAQTANATADDVPALDNGTALVLVGSLDSSAVIQSLISSEKLNTSELAGKWESFVVAVVDAPFEGVDRALVIAGSNKRGAIFGLYTLSEQIGVSPWYWWADIVPKKHDTIYAIPTTTTFGEPSVRYRGLFINDESPALNTSVIDNFGPKYNAAFYAHVFELLLRMKANFLWPAMWPSYPSPGNSFFVDDPLNQQTADAYGIVVSTSHHEPMQRATNEWLTSGNGTWDWEQNQENVTQFFEAGAVRAKGYESYFTLGMRGDQDAPLSGDDPMAILREVIGTQRSIIKDTYGNETAVKQVWALYKEVQELYEAGLEIPDDVTLLFSDDNFGNIRRLPREDELKRSGGTGIYYHCEYVGDPRSYKWLNTNSLGKAHQQLTNAHARGADRIWVINVADIKPMETPLSLIMSLAYNVSSITPDSIPGWLAAYAARELPAEHAEEAADILLTYSRLMGLRKHEHIESDTFSVIHYDEADRVLGAWNALLERTEALNEQLDEAYQPSFFQLVLHPIKASLIYNNVRVAQGKNAWYAGQRRNSANDWAGRTLDYFGQDYDLQLEWNAMLDGRWDQMMRQTHYGYRKGLWRAPIRDMITGLSYVQLRQDSYPAVGQLGVAVEGGVEPYPGVFNEGDNLAKPSRKDLVKGVTFTNVSQYGSPTRWFEVYGRGGQNVHWTASAEQPWVSLSASEGDVSAANGWDERVIAHVDFDAVPDGYNDTSLIYVNGSDGSYEELHLPVSKVSLPGDFSGFVEADGFVSMEAAHYTSSSDSSSFIEYPYLSRSINGSGAIGLDPSVGRNLSLPGDAPSLQFAFYQFSGAQNVTVTLYFTMALDTDPDAPFQYALSFDGAAPNATRLIPEPASAGDLPDGWTDAVMDQVWTRSATFSSSPGAHVLEYWANGPAVLLEKIVVDTGGLLASYLGPPESKRV
ncbi:hypothetical protein EV121DRAFT_212998 [Schizophyllum commune]